MVSGGIAVANFISHMVQIIQDVSAMSHLKKFLLYIPHGSDNTFSLFNNSTTAIPFISHMVQIILLSISVSESRFSTFISHMVQIILSSISLRISIASAFISHMVQIILCNICLTYDIKHLFISHMVQIILPIF